MPAASHHLSIDVSHLSWIAHTILQHFYKKSSPWFRPKQATCQPTQYVPWVTHTVVASKISLWDFHWQFCATPL